MGETRRVLYLLIIVLLVIALYPSSKKLNATGGAFTSTKHGGATTDSETPYGSGVDRKYGDDYGGTDPYPSTSEGTYDAGECGHCHEMHASFAGAEPLPDDTGDGATAYLLMKDYDTGSPGANSEICFYCHDNFSNISSSGSTAGEGRWEFYQGNANYTAASHYQSSDFAWPGNVDLETPGDIWPRKNARTIAASIGSCINCHTPHGVSGTYDAALAPSSSNYSATSTTPSGAGLLIPRQLIAREEALCLNCHDGSPASAGGVISAGTGDIKTQVDNYFATSGSGHPVRNSSSYGIHDLANESNISPPSIGWLNTAGSHAECTDCHNPHMAEGYGTGMSAPARGTVFQWSGTTSFHSNRSTSTYGVLIGQVNTGVWGASFNQSTGAFSSTIENLDPASNYVYELCFKCHSDWAWNGSANQPTSPSTTKTWSGAYMPSSLPMTNVPEEFINNATTNAAWHPVYGQGRNMPEDSNVANPFWCLTAGGTTYSWSQNYTTTCSLQAGTRTDLDVDHRNTLSQNFVPPWLHDSLITCVDCHQAANVDSSGLIARGPHGSSRPFILRGLDTTITYSITSAGPDNLTSVSYSAVPGCGGETGGTEWEYCGDASNKAVTTDITSSSVNNLCLNCHRPDVYGHELTDSNDLPRFYLFPRFRHPADWGSGGMRVLDSGVGGDLPRGIVCMRCHGGGVDSADQSGGEYDKLGVIHGAKKAASSDYGTVGRAFIAGTSWVGYTPGTTSSELECFPTKNSTFNACGQHGTGAKGSGTYANYDYTPP